MDIGPVDQDRMKARGDVSVVDIAEYRAAAEAKKSTAVSALAPNLTAFSVPALVVVFVILFLFFFRFAR